MDESLRLALSIKNKNDKADMIQIATSSDSRGLIQSLMSQDVPTQLKAFMVTQAKSELLRVIQLTDALNQLEDTYIERALNDKDNLALEELAGTLNVIVKSLNRSMDLINKITTDNSLRIIIDQSMNEVKSVNSNRTSLIEDQNSRERLRTVATQLFSCLSNNPDEVVNSGDF